MDTNKPVRITLGYLISFVVVGIPMFGWMLDFDFASRTMAESVAVTFAKIGAFGGMAMFAWSLILSGRYVLFDKLFQGLDKMYIVHRFFGTMSVVLLVIHPLGLIVLRSMSTSAAESLGLLVAFGDFAILLGLISLYGLVGTVLFSILQKIRHETFIQIHRWLGVFFIAGAYHAFLAGSVLASQPFMWWYMLCLSIVAVATFIHYSLLGDVLHPYYRYKIHSIKRLRGNVLDLRLTSRYRYINFHPGQFVYMQVDRLVEHGFHPFSIASGKRAGQLRFLIKNMGDFTDSLAKLKPGARVKIKGPYGGFTFDNSKHDKQLWIAGGIGVTPFLSKAHSLLHTKLWPEITMLYFVKNPAEAIARAELENIAERHKTFQVSIIDEEKFGITSLHDISEHLGGLSEYAIYICGPPPMLAAYQQQAKKIGVEDQLFFEEFSY
jgi:predicted ferric reductase